MSDKQNPAARTSVNPGEDPLAKAEKLSAELCEVLKELPPAEQLLVLRSLSDKIDASVPFTDRERRLNRLALGFSALTIGAGAIIYFAERSHGSNGLTGGTVALVGIFLLTGALSPYLTDFLKRP